MPAPVILVTGVSRGIGRALAEELRSRGAAFGAARNVADVPATASQLPGAGDVTQETGRKLCRCALSVIFQRKDGAATAETPSPFRSRKERGSLEVTRMPEKTLAPSTAANAGDAEPTPAGLGR